MRGRLEGSRDIAEPVWGRCVQESLNVVSRGSGRGGLGLLLPFAVLITTVKGKCRFSSRVTKSAALAVQTFVLSTADQR